MQLNRVGPWALTGVALVVCAIFGLFAHRHPEVASPSDSKGHVSVDVSELSLSDEIANERVRFVEGESATQESKTATSSSSSKVKTQAKTACVAIRVRPVNVGQGDPPVVELAVTELIGGERWIFCLEEGKCSEERVDVPLDFSLELEVVSAEGQVFSRYAASRRDWSVFEDILVWDVGDVVLEEPFVVRAQLGEQWGLSSGERVQVYVVSGGISGMRRSFKASMKGRPGLLAVGDIGRDEVVGFALPAVYESGVLVFTNGARYGYVDATSGPPLEPLVVDCCNPSRIHVAATDKAGDAIEGARIRFLDPALGVMVSDIAFAEVVTDQNGVADLWVPEYSPLRLICSKDGFVAARQTVVAGDASVEFGLEALPGSVPVEVVCYPPPAINRINVHSCRWMNYLPSEIDGRVLRFELPDTGGSLGLLELVVEGCVPVRRRVVRSDLLAGRLEVHLVESQPFQIVCVDPASGEALGGVLLDVQGGAPMSPKRQYLSGSDGVANVERFALGELVEVRIASLGSHHASVRPNLDAQGKSGSFTVPSDVKRWILPLSPAKGARTELRVALQSARGQEGVEYLEIADAEGRHLQLRGRTECVLGGRCAIIRGLQEGDYWVWAVSSRGQKGFGSVYVEDMNVTNCALDVGLASSVRLGLKNTKMMSSQSVRFALVAEGMTPTAVSSPNAETWPAFYPCDTLVSQDGVKEIEFVDVASGVYRVWIVYPHSRDTGALCVVSSIGGDAPLVDMQGM